jgi:FkbM family methyltransferase
MNHGNQHIRIPLDCFATWADVGTEYDFPAAFDSPPSVLDIGANSGAFMAFASWRLDARLVSCYEPNPAMQPYLEWNAQWATCPVGITCAAVGDPALTRLYTHHNCPSMFSQSPDSCHHHEEDFIEVRVIHPRELKPHNVVKIDTEGAEGFICENLPFTPGLLFVEYHTHELRQRVDAALSPKMDLAKAFVHKHQPGVGVLTYVKKI